MFSPRLRCVTRTGACPPLPRGAAPCPARCPGPCVATSVPPPATGGIVVPNRARTRLVHGPSHLGGTFGWRAPPCFFLLPKTLNLKKKSGLDFFTRIVTCLDIRSLQALRMAVDLIQRTGSTENVIFTDSRSTNRSLTF